LRTLLAQKITIQWNTFTHNEKIQNKRGEGRRVENERMEGELRMERKQGNQIGTK